MKLIQKNYPGEVRRPSVEAEIASGDSVVIVGTPWGTKEAFKELSETVKEYFAASLADGEATSPFARLPGLSQGANTLRIATFLANEAALNKYNKETYTSACEALLLSFNRGEVSWIQIGQPQLLLLRGNEIHPLSVTHDLSLDFGELTPLPTKLLGVDKQLELATNTLVLQSDDRLLMVARSVLPKSIFTQPVAGKTSSEILDLLFTAMAKADDRVPFWIAILDR